MKGDSLDGRSSKSKNPNSKQTSNFQIQNRPRRAGRAFIGWDLEFPWSLDLGISLVFGAWFLDLSPFPTFVGWNTPLTFAILTLGADQSGHS